MIELVEALRTELNYLRDEVQQLKEHQAKRNEETSFKKNTWKVVKDRGLKKTLVINYLSAHPQDEIHSDYSA